jgi:hypothetical protein
MERLARLALACACVACLTGMTWWLSRQLEADACLDHGHVVDWERGQCDVTARRLPGPTRWYDRLF